MSNTARVPCRILHSGAEIPAIGLGTFGSDHVSHDAIAEAVRYGASIGYKHFDCASVYANEDRIGMDCGDWSVQAEEELRQTEVAFAIGAMRPLN